MCAVTGAEQQCVKAQWQGVFEALYASVLDALCVTVACLQDFIGLVSEYIHAVVYDETETAEVRNQASATWHCLKRSAKAGPRRTVSNRTSVASSG